MSRPGRVRAPLVALLLAVLALAGGCAGATTTGQAETAMSDGLEQAASAVETASLTVTLLDEHRVTAPVADTALLDQVRVLEEASAAFATLVPPADLEGARDSGMTAVGTATSAVVAARSWADGESHASAEEILQALESAAADVEAVLAEVGA